MNIKLTATETRILGYVTRGLSNTEISEVMDVKKTTVRFHLKNIYKKTKCKNRAQLLSWVHERRQAR